MLHQYFQELADIISMRILHKCSCFIEFASFGGISSWSSLLAKVPVYGYPE